MNDRKERGLDYLAVSVLPDDYDRILDLTPEERGIWLTLCMYCAQRLSNGRVEGAATWTPEQWLRKMSMPPPPKEKEGYWISNDEDILLELYPCDKEEQVIKRREQARKAAAKRHAVRRAKRKQAEER